MEDDEGKMDSGVWVVVGVYAERRVEDCLNRPWNLEV